MKKLLFALLVGLACRFGYADTKISAMNSTSTLNAGDIVPVVTNPSGSAANFQINKNNLKTTLDILTISSATVTFASVGTSTASLQTQINSLNTSTATLNTSTTSLQTQVNTLSVSTATIQTQVNTKVNYSSFSATDPITYNSANGAIGTNPISLSTGVLGTLQAAQFPALTGDVTTSAGSLATTAAATQANIRTLTSSITVTGTGGIMIGSPTGSNQTNGSARYRLNSQGVIYTETNNSDTSAAAGYMAVTASSGAVPFYQGWRSSGTIASPLATKSGQTLIHYSGGGYGATGWGSSSGHMDFVADEDFTDSAKATSIRFMTSSVGGTTPISRVVVASSVPLTVLGSTIAINGVNMNWPSSGTVGNYLQYASTNTLQWGPVTASAATVQRSLGVTWDGGGSALTTGTTYWIVIPTTGTITEMVISGLASGSATVNVSSSSVFNTLPVSICASACPTLTSGTIGFDTTLTGWSKSIVKDGFLYFVVNSVSTISQLNVALEYQTP